MLPARFERAAFHLGGERSIHLSYGSGFPFGIVDCGLRIVKFRPKQSLVFGFWSLAESR